MTTRDTAAPAAPPLISDQALLLAGFEPGTPIRVLQPEPGRAATKIVRFLEGQPKRVIALEENDIVIYCGVRYLIPGDKDNPVPCAVPQAIAEVLAGKRSQDRAFARLSRSLEANSGYSLYDLPTVSSTTVGP